jgi:hypothetical protein
MTFAAFALLMLPYMPAPARAAEGEPPAPITDVELQPLAPQAQRVAQTLELLGSPLSKPQQQALDKACADVKQGVLGIQAVLDPLCLALVDINPESRVKVAAGLAPAKLMEQGWRVFLVKVHNEAGVTARLRISSPNAEPVFVRSSGSPEPKASLEPADVAQRWLDVATHDAQPLGKTLSGLALEYRVVALCSRESGQREAKLLFDVGQGTQDLGFRNELNRLFECDRAVKVELEVLDDDGQPTTAEFVIYDAAGRVYPSLARRLAPDFFFHRQIYRHSGEHVMLPPGEYQVDFGRGPEYHELDRAITVPEAAEYKETFRLKRWIKLADHGWYSGDHHIHAAGCAHYESPSQGVQPVDMLRHIQGEDLDVGCVLSWGPCWYFQKQFFEGKVNELSTPKNLMRYDVEVSGFPSSHAGHLCLLRLGEDDYPGTTRIDEWPSWDLPVLEWGKQQGAVVGFSHSGWGLQVAASKLPTYDMPPFDGIGANEYIVDVTHGVCDFISAVDTPAIWELNIWYHTLNCGYTTRISGETDFPCIYGERVGLGRSYVKLPKDQPLDYDRWVAGLRDGRSYVCDGLGHLFDFAVGAVEVGAPGVDNRPSTLVAVAGRPLEVRVKAAALLADKPREDIRSKPLDQKPYWHIERARIGVTDRVPVELIVNGRSVETQAIRADGSVQELKFGFTPAQSSWVALRIFPSAHTNPVFVEVDGKPIRASKKSSQWCLDAVDVCWQQKSKQIRAAEQPAAAAAYERARAAYRKILAAASDDPE